MSVVLTDEEIMELVELREKGWTLEALAERFGVHENTIRNVLRKLRKR